MLFEKISNICVEKGISISRLEKECGLGNGTVRRWKTIIPNVSTLQKVADYLHTTIEKLLAEDTTE